MRPFLTFRNTHADDIAAGNSIIAVSSPPVRINVVPVPPPRDTKFGAELPCSPKPEELLTPLPPEP